MTTMQNYQDATAADFDQVVLAADQPVLVDFWAPWCGPCRAVKPALQQLAADYQGRVKVVFVNVDDHPELAQRYQIQSIPALRLFAGGKLVDGTNGAASKEQLADFLDKSL